MSLLTPALSLCISLIGGSFEIMMQCQNSSVGRAVCMMCVALHGFHNKDSKYTWRRNV